MPVPAVATSAVRVTVWPKFEIVGRDVEGGRRGQLRDGKNAWDEPHDPVALGHEQRAVVGVHGDEIPARASRGNDGLGRRHEVHFDDCSAIGVDENISRHRPFAQGGAIHPARDEAGIVDLGFGGGVEAEDMATQAATLDRGIKGAAIGGQRKSVRNRATNGVAVFVVGLTS